MMHWTFLIVAWAAILIVCVAAIRRLAGSLVTQKTKRILKNRIETLAAAIENEGERPESPAFQNRDLPRGPTLRVRLEIAAAILEGANKTAAPLDVNKPRLTETLELVEQGLRGLARIANEAKFAGDAAEETWARENLGATIEAARGLNFEVLGGTEDYLRLDMASRYPASILGYY